MKKIRSIIAVCFLAISGVHSIASQELLKYPVVLVHGIVAHDRARVVRFWGRIPDVLRKNGVRVLESPMY